MNQYFSQARRAFQENLERDLWAGMVSLASGLEVEIEAIIAAHFRHVLLSA